MWVRRDVFDQVGGFDEEFFLYFEDYDLSLKMAQHGSVLEHGELRVVHHGGEAARKGWRHVRWFVGGAARFFNRWGWKWFGYSSARHTVNGVRNARYLVDRPLAGRREY